MLDLIHSPAQYLTKAYNHVDTRQLVDAFQKSGFNVSSQAKSTLRKPFNPALVDSFFTLDATKQVDLMTKYNKRLERYNARLGHEKHFMRLQSNELQTRAKGHDLFLRVTNSYDGTSSLKVSLDILRLVCLNGLVAPRSIFQIAVSHKSKNIYNDAIEASYKIIERKELIDSQIEAMSSKVLNKDEKELLIDNMFKFRFGQDTELKLDQSRKLELLKPVRAEENTDNLYQNFNTLQEKFTKGSKIFLVDSQGNEITSKTREVKSIITADSFNDQSWNFAASLVAA